jgi:hypothetical protein
MNKALFPFPPSLSKPSGGYTIFYSGTPSWAKGKKTSYFPSIATANVNQRQAHRLVVPSPPCTLLVGAAACQLLWVLSVSLEHFFYFNNCHCESPFPERGCFCSLSQGFSPSMASYLEPVFCRHWRNPPSILFWLSEHQIQV